MNFYDDPDNVQKYIEMCQGYDGSNIYDVLAEQVSANSALLELGSGAGLDIEHLKTRYSVTGSDLSDEFIKVCREKHPEIPFFKIDALKLGIDSRFDCIYSNKVLHHFTEAELKASLEQQAKLLKPNGKIAHSFWLGEKSQVINGMLFTYYNEETLLGIISESFEILSTLTYEEFEKDDSVFIVARLND